jgi:DnaJ-class molecular chaperone
MKEIICKYCQGLGAYELCKKCNGYGYFYTYEEKVSKPTHHGYSNKPSGSYTKDKNFN